MFVFKTDQLRVSLFKTHQLHVSLSLGLPCATDSCLSVQSGLLALSLSTVLKPRVVGEATWAVAA